MMKLPDGSSIAFPHWITLSSALQRWEDHFTPAMLSSFPDLAIEFVLKQFCGDDEKAFKMLDAIKGVKSYDAELVDRMLGSARLAGLIPKVFADCFDTFPAAAVHRCVASQYINQATLFFRLSSSSNPLHHSVHKELMQKVLEGPPDLHECGYVANMVRGHTRHDVLGLLGSSGHTGKDSWIWLVRKIERARGERLINESGELLS
jgi:hypothetical protein